MRKLFLLISLLSLQYAAFAQTEFTLGDDLTYAVIKDTDGYVNIRKAPNTSSAIVGKIYKYNVFDCEINKTNWWKVLQVQYDNHHKSSWLEGYIYSNRVTLLSNWKKINKKNVYPGSCVLKTDSLIISVTKKSFNPGGHKLTKSGQELYFIDGKVFWGTDGPIPQKSISKLMLVKNGKSICIPTDAFNDLYEPNLETLSVCYGPENTLYISMNNSDGAGAYSIVWAFKDYKYYSRYIDDSEE